MVSLPSPIELAFHVIALGDTGMGVEFRSPGGASCSVLMPMPTADVNMDTSQNGDTVLDEEDERLESMGEEAVIWAPDSASAFPMDYLSKVKVDLVHNGSGNLDNRVQIKLGDEDATTLYWDDAGTQPIQPGVATSVDSWVTTLAQNSNYIYAQVVKAGVHTKTFSIWIRWVLRVPYR